MHRYKNVTFHWFHTLQFQWITSKDHLKCLLNTHGKRQCYRAFFLIQVGSKGTFAESYQFGQKGTGGHLSNLDSALQVPFLPEKLQQGKLLWAWRAVVWGIPRGKRMKTSSFHWNHNLFAGSLARSEFNSFFLYLIWTSVYGATINTVKEPSASCLLFWHRFSIFNICVPDRSIKIYLFPAWIYSNRTFTSWIHDCLSCKAEKSV